MNLCQQLTSTVLPTNKLFRNAFTIKSASKTLGVLLKFVMEGDTGITYWIDRNFWGRGIATTALKKFLTIENTRPILGRVAFDNFASQKF